MKVSQEKIDDFWRFYLPVCGQSGNFPAFLEEYCIKSTAFVHHLCESGVFRFAMDRALCDIRVCAGPSWNENTVGNGFIDHELDLRQHSG